jgi:hypothetical protein
MVYQRKSERETDRTICETMKLTKHLELMLIDIMGCQTTKRMMQDTGRLCPNPDRPKYAASKLRLAIQLINYSLFPPFVKQPIYPLVLGRISFKDG